jgi:uncharacterized protein
MPVNPTYPGIYIEELPSSTHTITPAPTSVAVFIGYTHPYKTQNFNQPVAIFSFSDYQRAFGGLYHNAWLDSNVAYAVQQFFLNGGSEAYVFGLPSALFTPSPSTSGSSISTTGAFVDSGGVRYWAQEPIDPAHTMTVLVSNPNTTAKTADITVTYGALTASGSPVDFATAETFRGVSFDTTSTTSPNFIANRINGSSSLLWVTATPVTAGTATAWSAATLTLPAPSTPAVSILNQGGDPTTAAFLASDFTGPLTNPNSGPFVTDGALDKVPIFNLMVLPGVTDISVWAQAIAFCERRRAFLIMDPPPNFSADGLTPANLKGMTAALQAIATVAPGVGPTPTSINAALYFPYVTTLDSLSGNPTRLPPSGYVAGIYAQTDNNRGVWKAPAGLATTLTNASGVVAEGVLTDNRAGVLNPIGIDVIRTFAGSGTVVFGARTTTTANTALQQWRYVPVRRTALFIEQTLYANLGWAVFEPNDTPLWTALRTTVEAFMLTLFNQGAFPGATPSQAFQVVCDSTTTTQTDIDNGIVNILVAFAPLVPAEFVVIQIAQLAGQAQSS